MLKTFRYRLYPTKAQQRALNTTLNECRWLYNQLLEQRKTLYESERRSITCFEQINQIPAIKQERTSLKSVPSQTLQNVAKRIELGMQSFFRRIKRGETPGYPRFRSHHRYDSITFPQVGNGCKLTADGFLALSKIGNVPIILHRPLEGKAKSAVIKRTPTGKWFVTFSCEWEPKQLPPNDRKIGIDMGVRVFAMLSDGTKIENPKFFKAEQKALAKSQRKLAKQTKGTPKRAEARKAVARVYERMSWRRDNFAHQQSRQLVNRYGTLYVEALQIQSLLQKDDSTQAKNRGIADAAWRQFLSLLHCKAEWAGRQFLAVNPAYTSKTCSVCGHIHKDHRDEIVFVCPRCSHNEHRDLNAAKNIFALGTQCAGAPSGASQGSHRL